ncbi:MAG: ferrous iron transport protein B [Clostridia bacterium]|nr:ferrous iron transport protein B [Clostridia bacterium]
MGLTNSSTGLKALDSNPQTKRKKSDDIVIALAGNPNVGKSTVFNGLTGMNQHTGNWPGKTVASADGICVTENNRYVLVDIPGTYSLMAHSVEEEVARNYLCFGEPDAVIVVCDATCLERNLNLVLQTIEISKNVIVCVNLMDEAKRKKIKINLNLLSKKLGVPVISTVAHKKSSLKTLTDTLDKVISKEIVVSPLKIEYPEIIESAIKNIQQCLMGYNLKNLDSRWLSLKLLDDDQSLIKEVNNYLGFDLLKEKDIKKAVNESKEYLNKNNINADKLKDMVVSIIVKTSEDICNGVITYEKKNYSSVDRNFDKILTSKYIGYPIMLLMLMVIFWLTITGANYPSAILSDFLFWIQDRLTDIFMYFNAPDWLHGALVLGVYRVLTWVVSVMLPPMAIFFPLFTLLEDSGYLPRVAYNLDKPFKCCSACGKQSLTMCMGFGCNAAGVVGCRIIDSPRERLLAILTNNFVPCNGRFPTIITILTMFFVGSSVGIKSSLLSSILLTLVILLGILTTFAVTKILSRTILKGVPSSYTLELPPYRKPQVGKVIIRSIFDRTLFVLGRAAAVAAPAGLVIWLMANITVGEANLLTHVSEFLDPFAKIMGLDGVILMAFILGFPANEIVIPIIIMTYLAKGTIVGIESVSEMKEIFLQNGWTWLTAVNTIIFSLMHWPCSTTLITIKKETGSFKWAALSAVIPTVLGITFCIIITAIAKIFI